MYLNRTQIGKITNISDAIISISGLDRAFIGEVVCFKYENNELLGLVLNVDHDEIKTALIKGSERRLAAGDKVWKTYKAAETKAGFGLIGRVINPLGVCYNKGDIDIVDYVKNELYNVRYTNIDREAPGIIQREPVRTPLHTGINAIDCLLPIGCGQRELIIGDLGTGKTTLALTIIINQKRRNNNFWRLVEKHIITYKHMLFIPCIYVAIGGRRSEAARIKRLLQDTGAISYTTFVFTSADDLACLQYLAPYAGTAVGEWYRDLGYRALIIYDELLIHAQSYRQVSLLLRRPPGREAYPGDIFFVHSRLLERSAQMNRRCGGGSLTSLPVVETKAGDISAYIPTNIISITDGQIFLSTKLSNQGIRPAIDLNLSVSRVGSDAQVLCMKAVSKSIKVNYGNYRMYAGIEKMGTEIDPIIYTIIVRGKQIVEYFKQDVYETESMYRQVVSLYTLGSGKADTVSVDDIRFFFNLLFDIKTARKYLHAKSYYLVALQDKMEFVVNSIKFDKLRNRMDSLISSFVPAYFNLYKPRALQLRNLK
jgi:proton translocating ATP synthase F1 alpha subunit